MSRVEYLWAHSFALKTGREKAFKNQDLAQFPAINVYLHCFGACQTGKRKGTPTSKPFLVRKKEKKAREWNSDALNA